METQQREYQTDVFGHEEDIEESEDSCLCHRLIYTSLSMSKQLITGQRGVLN